MQGAVTSGEVTVFGQVMTRMVVACEVRRAGAADRRSAQEEQPRGFSIWELWSWPPSSQYPDW